MDEWFALPPDQRAAWLKFFERHEVDPKTIPAQVPQMMPLGVVYSEFVINPKNGRALMTPRSRRWRVRARLIPRKLGVY